MAPASLVGREHELRRIRDLIETAVTGRGGALWITGEPGLGKSALLDVFESEGRERDLRVLHGTAQQMAAGLPFAAIASCFGSEDPASADVAAQIGDALRGDGRPDASIAAYRELAVIELILDQVEEWCAAGPVAFLLDDAQWADRPSLLALHRIGLEVEQQPLVLGLAARSAPHNDDLAQLLADLERRGGHALRLTPLTRPNVAEFVERLVGARPDPELLRLVSGAAGSPLYLRELLAALSRDGRISIADGIARPEPRPDDARLPVSLAEAILRRMDFLSRPARSVLQVTATLGAGLNVADLSVILDKSPAQLYEMIAEAIEAGLLIDSGGELVFRHDLIRQALSESVPATVREALWAQAAHALADAGVAVERVVRYLSDDAALDSRMLDWLTASADALVVRAPQAAVDLLERALARIESADSRVPTLRRQLVRALLWFGEPERAEQAARAALTGDTDRAAEVALRSLLVHACFQQGRIRRAQAEAEEAMRLPGLTTAQAARFEFLAMQCRFTRGDLDPAEEPAASRMMAVDDAEVRAYGLNYLACLRYVRGRYRESLELVDRAQAAVADREALPEWTSGNALSRAFCLVELDRPAEALEAFEAGTRQAERHGSVYWSWYRLGTAGVHFVAGRWDDALAEIKAGLDMIETLGAARELNSGWGLRSQAALVAAHRGDLETSISLLSMPESVHRQTFYGYLRLWSEALVQEAQNHPREALDLLLDAWVNTAELRLHRGLHYLCPDLARLATSLGQTRQAHQLADDVAELADTNPVPSMRATAHLCRAFIDGDPDLMLDAQRDYAAAGRPLYEAYAAENAAVLLAEAQRTQEARVALATATQLYDWLEARWDIARADRRLRRVGIRRSGSSTRRRPKSGWDSLTETERKIAALVAEGNSNPAIATRLFISRRTVQSHVSSILTKLDLTSRVELAVLAHQHIDG